MRNHMPQWFKNQKSRKEEMVLGDAPEDRLQNNKP
jgi:hypothetical protein